MSLLAQASAAGANTAEVVLFWVFAVIGLGAGIAMVTMRNVVHSALMLVVNFLAIAALYLGLQSGFLAVVQVIVYAGAIMVLFLFVIMLLGVHRDDLLVEVRTWHRTLAVLGAAAVAGVLLLGIVGTYTTSASRCGDQAPQGVVRTHDEQPCAGMEAALANSETGSVGVVGERLFTRYTFPFEAAAVLLTVATIGAMLLGRRDDVPQDEDPAFAPSADVPDERDLETVGITVPSREEVQGEEAMHPGAADEPVLHRLPDDAGDAGYEYDVAPEAGDEDADRGGEGRPWTSRDTSPRSGPGIGQGLSGGTTLGDADTADPDRGPAAPDPDAATTDADDDDEGAS